MRKIEAEMITAIKNGKDYKKDNTSSWEHKEGTVFRVYLHGYMIVEKQDSKLVLGDCGHQTKTTKSRLNAILSLYDLGKIYSKNYQWYFNDEEWTGSKEFEINS